MSSAREPGAELVRFESAPPPLTLLTREAIDGALGPLCVPARTDGLAAGDLLEPAFFAGFCPSLAGSNRA